MLSKYIKFENFKSKINKKKYNYLNREVKFNNLLSKYPFLETLTKEKSNNTVQGDLIKSIFLTSTMGVSYKLKLTKSI